jgi:hypothetical protein
MNRSENGRRQLLALAEESLALLTSTKLVRKCLNVAELVWWKWRWIICGRVTVWNGLLPRGIFAGLTLSGARAGTVGLRRGAATAGPTACRVIGRTLGL